MINFRSEPQIQFCRAVIRLSDVNENALYDLFDLIQAPGTLQAFFVHLPLLPGVLKAVNELLELNGFVGDRYIEAAYTAEVINTLLPDLQNDFRLRDLHATVPTPRFGPCQGILKTHPLYSILAENIPHKDFHIPFTYLKAHVLLAIESIVQTREGWSEDTYESLRCVRNITKPQNWGYLATLPSKPITTLTLVAIIKSKFPSALKPIGKIFENIEKAFSKRKRQQPSTTKSKVVTPKLEREDDEEPVAEYVSNIQLSTALAKDESEYYISHGGLPDEMGANIELEPVLAEDKYHGPTRRQLTFQAKQANNRRAMANQFCALAWNQANIYDLKVLFGFLEGRSSPEIVDYQPMIREEAAIVLGLMLFTCNTLERVLSLSVYAGVQPILKAPEGLYYNDGKVIVRLLSTGPQLDSQVRQITGAFSVDNYINLHIPDSLAKCFEGIQNNPTRGLVRRHLLSNVDPADGQSVQQVYTILRRILGECNRNDGTRLSLGRINSYLLFRVAESEKCDLPSAMLLFGRNDKFARTRIHYTLASDDDLETAYKASVNSLLANVDSLSRPLSHVERDNAGGYLGTPFCPLPKTVRDLSKNLRVAVASSSCLSLAERHNRFALYTAMLISYGTGFRAIHDPSFKEMEIDFEWGIGIISDKGEASYRSRYVYLAPVVLEQIKYYRQHMQFIYGQLGVTNPSLFALVRDMDYEGLPLNLFWLKGDMDPLELLKPGVAKNKLNHVYNYSIPLNAGRHYLKYRLLQSGCSPELIEAQLGHWENGQEPWGIFSNLDPLAFIDQLGSHLSRVLKEDGWQAIKGPC